MRLLRTVAVGVMAWAALGTIAHAAPLSWTSRQPQWPIWYANQSLSDGSIISQNPTAGTQVVVDVELEMALELVR